MGGAALGGGIASAVQGSIANFLSIKEAKKQRQFIEKMYKHRYQYQMEDMREAGLNPILSYSQAPPGGPQGGIARIEAPDIAGSARAGAQASLAGKDKALRLAQIQSEEQRRKTLYADAERAHSAAQVNYQEAALKAKQQRRAQHQMNFFGTPAGKAAVYGSEVGTAVGKFLGAGRGYGRGVFRPR